MISVWSWMERPASVQFPGGESFAHLKERALESLELIRDTHEAAVVVTHGGAARMLRHAAGQDEHFSAPALTNCEVLKIAVRQDSIRGLD